MSTVVVVGSSVAGISAAETLRRKGFDGRVVVVGDEQAVPYDRPPLSKDVLTTSRGIDDLLLRPAGLYRDLDISLCLGKGAERLDLRERRVTLDGGAEIHFDGLVIATGARARWPGTWPRLDGTYTLRTLDDALRLRTALAGGSRILIVGAGFIGLEVAASARTAGLDVTVLEAAACPLAHAVGHLAGAAVARMHADRGVNIVSGVGVSHLVGTDRVEGVVLQDGRTVDAEIVVVGLGSTPNTEWLEGSGLALDAGVRCDDTCYTGVEGVFAAGDVARWDSRRFGAPLRIEHWTNALEQGALAAANLLGDPGQRRGYDPVPYFWSDQYGKRLQFAGHCRGDETPTVVHGSFDTEDWVVVYQRAGNVVAVLACDQPRLFLKYRRQLSAAADDGSSNLVGLGL